MLMGLLHSTLDQIKTILEFHKLSVFFFIRSREELGDCMYILLNYVEPGSWDENECILFA